MRVKVDKAALSLVIPESWQVERDVEVTGYGAKPPFEMPLRASWDPDGVGPADRGLTVSVAPLAVLPGPDALLSRLKEGKDNYVRNATARAAVVAGKRALVGEFDNDIPGDPVHGTVMWFVVQRSLGVILSVVGNDDPEFDEQMAVIIGSIKFSKRAAVGSKSLDPNDGTFFGGG